MSIVRTWLVFVCLTGVVLACSLVPEVGRAQGVFSGTGADTGSRRRGGYTAPPVDRSPSSVDRTPRLEAGSLLCPTEAALQQYQVAVQARAEGRDAPSGRGCRLVQQSTAVTVVERRSGRVHVRIAVPGLPGEGWTDAALPG